MAVRDLWTEQLIESERKTIYTYEILFYRHGIMRPPCHRWRMYARKRPRGWQRTNQTPLIVKATASNFNHLSISGSPFARTPLEDGAETQFSAGDAIGIFAVKIMR